MLRQCKAREWGDNSSYKMLAERYIRRLSTNHSSVFKTTRSKWWAGSGVHLRGNEEGRRGPHLREEMKVVETIVKMQHRDVLFSTFAKRYSANIYSGHGVLSFHMQPKIGGGTDFLGHHPQITKREWRCRALLCSETQDGSKKHNLSLWWSRCTSSFNSQFSEVGINYISLLIVHHSHHV